MRYYDVITIGETTIDAFMRIHDANEKVHLDAEKNELCVKYGEKVNVKRYDFSIGGNATNVAVGLSRLGLNAAPCVEIGDDEFSMKIRNALAQENIERLLVKETHGQSSFSVIMSFKTDRTIFVQDVARDHDFDFHDVTAKYVFLTSLGREWEKPYKHALEFAATQGAKIAFNPGHLQLQEGRDTVRSVLSKTDILVVNKEEAELLLFHHYNEKIDNTERYIDALMERLQKLGPRSVIITNGRKGSHGRDSAGNVYSRDMYPGEIVERTGAGDGYTSGFLAGTIHGKTFGEAMQWGSINAAAVVQHIGAQVGLLTKEEMEKKL